MLTTMLLYMSSSVDHVVSANNHSSSFCSLVLAFMIISIDNYVSANNTHSAFLWLEVGLSG